MIINEKYLQDIDDDDDDDVLSDQPSSRRVIPDANVKFDHYVKICYSYMFKTHPTKYSSRTDGDITYGTFTEIYDQIDDFMDYMIPVTDYHIRITAIIDKENTNWWVTPNVPPNYDSDVDYGKMDEFDSETESTIYDFTIEVKYNCMRMTFEQFLKIIFKVRSYFKEIYKLSYTSLSFTPSAMNYDIDGFTDIKMDKNHAFILKQHFNEIFPSRIKQQDEASYPNKFEYRNDAVLSKKSEKCIGQFLFGDILYETSGGELVSQEFDENGNKNEPIGIYILPYRFMSIRYMSTTDPNRGSKRFNFEENMMLYGSIGARIDAGNAPFKGARYGNKDEDYRQVHVSGESDFRKMLEYMNKTYEKRNGDKSAYFSNHITHENQKGLLQGALCTYRFHTKGTKQGNWYIPSPSELHYLFGEHKLFKYLSDNIPTDMQDAPFTAKINNSEMVNVHKAINFIMKNKLHLRPLQEGYFYMTSRETDKNNYVGISTYRGSAQALNKKYNGSPALSIVLPFIYVNDQH